MNAWSWARPASGPPTLAAIKCHACFLQRLPQPKRADNCSRSPPRVSITLLSRQDGGHQT
eukprot:4080977-Pyramimonas_sp.AAC.1